MTASPLSAISCGFVCRVRPRHKVEQDLPCLVSVVREDPFEINGRRKYTRARFPVSARSRAPNAARMQKRRCTRNARVCARVARTCVNVNRPAGVITAVLTLVHSRAGCYLRYAKLIPRQVARTRPYIP